MALKVVLDIFIKTNKKYRIVDGSITFVYLRMTCI